MTALGVLCVVCLTLLASFFLPSHLSLKHVHHSLSLAGQTLTLSGSGPQRYHSLLYSVCECLHAYMYRQLIFLGKVTALGVLCCFALFVCLTLLASFFLPSHLSFKNMGVLKP